MRYYLCQTEFASIFSAFPIESKLTKFLKLFVGCWFYINCAARLSSIAYQLWKPPSIWVCDSETVSKVTFWSQYWQRMRYSHCGHMVQKRAIFQWIWCNCIQSGDHSTKEWCGWHCIGGFTRLMSKTRSEKLRPRNPSTLLCAELEEHSSQYK